MGKDPAKETRELTDIEWAYLAGIVDGEGSITASSNGQDRIRVTVTSTSRGLIDWMVARVGGSVCNRRPASPRHKPTYGCEVSYVKAKSFLRGVLPYLLIKARHAELALQFSDTMHAHVEVTDEIKSFRRWGVRQIKRMNQRGPVV